MFSHCGSHHGKHDMLIAIMEGMMVGHGSTPSLTGGNYS